MNVESGNRCAKVDDFATDCERETMEMNQNQRSDGECRWRIGQSRAMVRPVEATRYRDFGSFEQVWLILVGEGRRP